MIIMPTTEEAKAPARQKRVRALPEFGDTFTTQQLVSMEGTWVKLQTEYGLKHNTHGAVHFVCIKAPGQQFDYQGMQADSLMQGNGTTPTISVVCDRFGPDCLYLESPDLLALKFFLWKYVGVDN